MQKIYCYADESGQDTGSNHFIVAVVAVGDNRELLRKQLERIEREACTNGLKWHKTRHDRRMRYLALALERGVGS